MRRIASLLIALSLVSWFGIRSDAQSTNPTQVQFQASPDHNSVAVTSYSLQIIVGNEGGAVFFTQGLGKPTPDGAGVITVPLPSIAQTGTYVVTVTATGPGGSATSPASDPFAYAGAPGAPGKPIVG